MQERYLGDIHDYFKFLFLKYLSSYLKTKIGLNWYLVNPNNIGKKEIEKNDGEKRNFLKIKSFTKLDPKIIKELKYLKAKKNRKISCFTKNSHLKYHINFYNEYLELDNRENWFRKSVEILKNEKIIFLDPDNGFKSNFKGSKSLKYVVENECRELLMRDKIVIFTQFQSFNKHHLLYLKEIFFTLRKYKLKPTLPIIRNRTAPNTFYITLMSENIELDIKSIYENYQKRNNKIELIKNFNFSSQI